MEGIFGLLKMVISFRIRLPPSSVNLPRRLRVQPPRHCCWSSYRRGYPCPGRVSTLLNQTYSTPDRLVHACLQVTEQVWHPMHLSRFITIAIWAMTLIDLPPRRWLTSELDLLASAADHRDLVALVTGGTQIVERERQLRVAADQVGRLE